MIGYQSITSPPVGSIVYPLDSLNPMSNDEQQLFNFILRSLIPEKHNYLMSIYFHAVLTFDTHITITHTTIATTSTLNRNTGTTMATTSIQKKVRELVN